MQVTAFGIEFATDGIGRYNDLCLIVYLHQMFQSSRMVAVSVRDKHIIYGTEVDTHLLCITDKHIACTRIQQDTMFICL